MIDSQLICNNTSGTELLPFSYSPSAGLIIDMPNNSHNGPLSHIIHFSLFIFKILFYLIDVFLYIGKGAGCPSGITLTRICQQRKFNLQCRLILLKDVGFPAISSVRPYPLRFGRMKEAHTPIDINIIKIVEIWINLYDQ